VHAKVEPRRWNERKTKPAWIENRGWEFTSTGKLELVVHGPGTSYNGDHYRDAKIVRVEEKLPEVFRSFEIYRLRVDWQEQQRQREKADRRRLWEAAMASAKEQYFEHARWEHFTERSRACAAINQHRDFLLAEKKAAESYSAEKPRRYLAASQIRGADPGRTRPRPCTGTSHPPGNCARTAINLCPGRRSDRGFAVADLGQD
jgi:hypothetical protein